MELWFCVSNGLGEIERGEYAEKGASVLRPGLDSRLPQDVCL
jgi:hypothetical protein